MPIRKFRSISEMQGTLRLKPETMEHTMALRSVFWMAARFAPRPTWFPGVRKYRTLEEAQADRRFWTQPALTPENQK